MELLIKINNQPVSMHPEIAILDANRIMSRYAEHPRVMRETSLAFIKFAPGFLEELTSAVVNGDHPYALSIIRALRSSAFILASASLLTELGNFRERIISASPDVLPEHTIRITRIVQALCREIIQFVHPLDFTKTHL